MPGNALRLAYRHTMRETTSLAVALMPLLALTSGGACAKVVGIPLPGTSMQENYVAFAFLGLSGGFQAFAIAFALLHLLVRHPGRSGWWQALIGAVTGIVAYCACAAWISVAIPLFYDERRISNGAMLLGEVPLVTLIALGLLWPILLFAVLSFRYVRRPPRHQATRVDAPADTGQAARADLAPVRSEAVARAYNGAARFDRTRFFAFGVVPAVNAVILLLHGLGLATHGTGGAGRSLPALIAMAAICLLMACGAAIRRGRDIGWPAWRTVVLFFLAVGMGPVLLGLIGYFALARSRNDTGEPASAAAPATVSTWSWAALNVIWPWATLGVLAAIL